ncbi:MULTISPECIES: phage protein Gp36 family protein [Sorangium]|uniref:phage protein Gp36 family protein n=1 Tax=Sorangium TaxID=39643 RepID=UPI003D9C183A
MSCYVTVQDVMDLGILLQEDIDWLEQRYPGIVLRIATKVSGYVDGRLAKRYGVPFVTPYDDGLVDAVAGIVAYRLYVKRGGKPEGTKAEAAVRAHDAAMAWITEAADSKDGLVELVRTQSSPRGETSVNKGGPLGYSEASPYTWMDRQRGAASEER